MDYNCFKCGNKLEKVMKNYTTVFNSKLTVLKNIPHLYCSKCEEYYFNEEMSKVIDEKLQKGVG